MKARKATTKKPTARRASNGGGKKGGEMVTFTPTRNLPLTINGVTIEVQAGVETTVPANYKTQYDNAS